MKIKEEVLKDMFPDKQFIFIRKDGGSYISTDAVDVLLETFIKKILEDVRKEITCMVSRGDIIDIINKRKKELGIK